MKRIEQRGWRFRALVGVLLTALAVAADAGGLLRFLENTLADARQRYSQWFVKPAAPPVHLDIDDDAVNAIGAWPWPRTVLAGIVRELHDAGARTVALDLLFEDVHPDEDAALADALGVGDGSIIAVRFSQLGQPPPASAGFTQFVTVLLQDLELSPEQALARVEAAGQRMEQSREALVAVFVPARARAMYQRIEAELDQAERGGAAIDEAALRARLLPREVPGANSPVVGLLTEQLDKARRARALRRHFRKAPGLARACHAVNEDPPVMALTEQAGGCGFVNYLPDADGKVRAVPLWLETDGYFVPYVGLAVACKMLDVKIEQVRIERDAVVIPRPAPAGEIVIPVRSHWFREAGEVPLCIDVPMTGGPKWETMYDRPRFERFTDHLSVLSVYRLKESRDAMAMNESHADSAVLDVLDVVDPEFAGTYRLLSAEVRPREAGIARAMAAIPSALAGYEAIQPPPPEIAAIIARFKAAGDFLPRVLEENQRFAAQIEADKAALRAAVEGRAVLIGWTRTGNLDYVPTPLHSRCPGVVVHGAIYNGIMSGELWRTAAAGWTMSATAVIGLLATLFVMRFSPVKALAAVVAMTVGYLVVNWIVLFDYGDVMLGQAGPVAAAAAGWAGLTLIGFITEIGERGRITRRFQTYVDPRLVNFVIDHPDEAVFAGREKELTVVFTDLQGFTTLSEKLGGPSVRILSRFMEAMVPIIRRHNGYVNKFLGDGIMFFYGAPIDNADHARDAVATVLEMQRAMGPFNATLEAEGLPTLTVRAGISTGMMVVGDAGPSFAADYTVIGDRVNLAARLESANKATGTRNLITVRTVELAGEAFLFRPVAALQVVGKEQAAMTYEAICPISDASDAQHQLVELTRRMVNRFIARDFDGCCLGIESLESAFGPSKLTDLYRRHCTACNHTPPAEVWAGEIALTEK